jgi:hypothetical protein
MSILILHIAPSLNSYVTTPPWPLQIPTPLFEQQHNELLMNTVRYLSFDDECNVIVEFLALASYTMDEKDRSANFVEFILRRAQQNSELTTNKQARRLLELIRTNPAFMRRLILTYQSFLRSRYVN